MAGHLDFPNIHYLKRLLPQISMCIGFCHIYMFFSLEWSPSKVEGDISILKEVHDCQIAFPKKLYKFIMPSAIYMFPYTLATLAIPKKTKRLLLRLNKFSFWQLLKDLCLLTSMSVGMCNRNFLYQQKIVSSHKKRRKTDLEV